MHEYLPLVILPHFVTHQQLIVLICLLLILFKCLLGLLLHLGVIELHLYLY